MRSRQGCQYCWAGDNGAAFNWNLPSYLRDPRTCWRGPSASNHTSGPGQVEQVDLDSRTAGCWDRYDRTNLASRQNRPCRNRVMESSVPHWLAQASHAWAAREQTSQMTNKRKWPERIPCSSERSTSAANASRWHRSGGYAQRSLQTMQFRQTGSRFGGIRGLACLETKLDFQLAWERFPSA
jgi:hypothetical protein